MTSKENPEPAEDPTVWSLSDWLAYYGQCRDFQGGLATRFALFLRHASVFSVTACTILIAFDRVGIEWAPAYLLIGGTALLPLGLYWTLIIAYYGQVKTTGDILVELERTHLREVGEQALLTRMRAESPFYGSPRGAIVVRFYPALLAVFILVTSGMLFVTNLSTLTTQTERDGAVQPATALDPKLEDDSKPQSESGARSQ